MILNLRVDHKIANIDAMENIAKEMDQLFLELQEKYSIVAVSYTHLTLPTNSRV